MAVYAVALKCKKENVSAMNQALDKIHDRTGENPLQVLINAVKIAP